MRVYIVLIINKDGALPWIKGAFESWLEAEEVASYYRDCFNDAQVIDKVVGSNDITQIETMNKFKMERGDV